jgi:DMSO reductase family type II enzyme chaperone
MSGATAEERALARAAIYRLLAVAFAYPTRDALDALDGAREVAGRAAEVMDPRIGEAIFDLEDRLSGMSQADLEATYQRSFTLSYNEDCPLYETAFSARHIFQQTQQQADIAGFYRAFGVDPHAERPDHLALELEFLYLVALKEAWARADREADHIAVCRDAQRSFLREHLSRWAPQIAGRIALAGRGTFYESAARLLRAFLEAEERYMRLGKVEPFSEEPILIADEPGEFTCPMVDTFVPVDIQPLQGSK